MEAVTTPPPAEPEHRWPALRTISSILKVVAWIILIVGGIAVIIAAIATGSEEPGAGILTFIVGAITVALYALFTFASAELLRLFVAVEENTRLGSGRR